MEKNDKLNHICPETEFVSVLNKELMKKMFVKVNETFDTKCNPKEQIKILAEKTRTCQIHDFKSWETEVLSTINELLRSTNNGAQEETDVIMKNMDNIESKMVRTSALFVVILAIILLLSPHDTLSFHI